jgi:hypothetical protein
MYITDSGQFCGVILVAIVIVWNVILWVFNKLKSKK